MSCLKNCVTLLRNRLAKYRKLLKQWIAMVKSKQMFSRRSLQGSSDFHEYLSQHRSVSTLLFKTPQSVRIRNVCCREHHNKQNTHGRKEAHNFSFNCPQLSDPVLKLEKQKLVHTTTFLQSVFSSVLRLPMGCVQSEAP